VAAVARVDPDPSGPEAPGVLQAAAAAAHGRRHFQIPTPAVAVVLAHIV